MSRSLSEETLRIFHGKRLADRQIDELIGLACGLVADNAVNQQEVEFLRNWLVANKTVIGNPVVDNLLLRISEMLSDANYSSEEEQELRETLKRFSGNEDGLALGELLKPTTLPLDSPPPPISFVGVRFCFTGTFTFGSRADCEAAVERHGGHAGPLTMATKYLVVGAYATDSWMHSTYGRKIERAVEMRDSGVPIFIVGETHWRMSVD